MSIRAVIKDGQIQLVDPLPPDWAEGGEVVVSDVEINDRVPTKEELDAWESAVRTSAERILPEDHERFLQALEEQEREQRLCSKGMGACLRPGFLLDTNQLGAAVRPTSLVRKRIIEQRAKGVRIGTCMPVLCELEVGARVVSDPDLYQQHLTTLRSLIRIWPLDRETAFEYGVIHRELKAQGRVLSQVDMMLAAMAMTMRLTLVTTDRDFEALPDIPTENWTK